MRALLLQPEDFLHSGPWSAQPWDLIVSMGRSSISQTHQAGLHLDAYGEGLSDARIIRESLRTGRRHMIDALGIDCWELISIAIVQEAEAVQTRSVS